jgi:hypothetical protein
LIPKSVIWVVKIYVNQWFFSLQLESNNDFISTTSNQGLKNKRNEVLDQKRIFEKPKGLKTS